MPIEPCDACSFLGMPAVIASSEMRELRRYVERIAQTNAAVLITGESGSGKEVIARAVHEYSERKGKPWIDINCAALPDHLFESEVFGYEKGAFSGADSAKPGMFELAHEGTLFLDEIGDLDLKCQSKLLRVLDGWPHYRLGGTRKVILDVRIVAATNSDLEMAVRSGKFRSDLFHRLNQVRVNVPPLRERIDDIVPLANHFLALENPALRLAGEAVEALQLYTWPGNVRELRSLMALVAVMANDTVIRLEDLPPVFHGRDAKPTSQSHSLGQLEQELILAALVQTAGRRDRAAEMLGISRRTLIRRLKVYGARSAGMPACDGMERS